MAGEHNGTSRIGLEVIHRPPDRACRATAVTDVTSGDNRPGPAAVLRLPERVRREQACSGGAVSDRVESGTGMRADRSGRAGTASHGRVDGRCGAVVQGAGAGQWTRTNRGAPRCLARAGHAPFTGGEPRQASGRHTRARQWRRPTRRTAVARSAWARSASTAAAGSSAPYTAEPATNTSAPASAHRSMVSARDAAVDLQPQVEVAALDQLAGARASSAAPGRGTSGRRSRARPSSPAACRARAAGRRRARPAVAGRSAMPGPHARRRAGSGPAAPAPAPPRRGR